MKFDRYLHLFFILSLLSLLAGCGSDTYPWWLFNSQGSGATVIVLPDQAAGSSLSAKVSIPQGAVPAGQSIPTMTFTSDSASTITIPAGATVGSKLYIFTKNSTYTFTVPIDVTIPYDPSLSTNPNDFPGVYWYDQVNNKYFAATLKNIDPANKTLTFSTIHFSRFIVFFSPSVNLQSTVDTGFAPATDGFFHPNLSTGDASLGMSDFAIYYFNVRKAGDTSNLYPVGVQGLYHKYREGDPNLYQDDVIARTLIAKAQSAASAVWNAVAYLSSSVDQKTTGLQLLSTMIVTQSPQALVLKSTQSGKVVYSHVVTVYKYDPSGIFFVYDPNFPGEEVTISWSAANGFANYSKQAAYNYTFNDYTFEGLLSVAESAQFDTLYLDAENSFTGGNYATITVTTPQFDANGSYSFAVTDPNNVTIPVSGSVAGGTPSPGYLMWSLNGGLKKVITLSGGSFSFTVTNPSGSINTLVLEATSDPLDPWKTSAISVLTIKLTGQAVTFLSNPGFESSDPSLPTTDPRYYMVGWTVESHTWQDCTFDFSGSPVPTDPDFNPDYGKILTVSNQNYDPTVDPWKSAIVTAGFDPIATSLSMVRFGANALRINNQDNYYHISSASQTGTIPNSVAARPEFKFSWAAVLQDPQHPYYDQPFVDVVVKDLDSNTVLYSKHFFTNDPRYSGWKVVGSWKMIDWQDVVIDVSKSKGHRVIITVTAADCNQGGHGGYAYLDMDQ